MTKQKQADTTPFQELLRRLLSSTGTSYRKLAKQSGVSVSSIPKWLSGQVCPNPHTCILLADHFDIYPNTLLEAAGHRPLKFLQRETLDLSMVHPDTIALVEKLGQIREPYHREIVEILGLVVDGYVLKHQAEAPDREASGRGGRLMSYLDQMTGSGDYIFSYVDGRPYRAVMYGRGQFILLMTRSKDLVSPVMMQKIVDEALNRLASLQKRSPRISPFGSPTCYLTLRGVWFDDAHGCVDLHVEQLLDDRIEPVFSDEEIKHALFHGGAGRHGQVVRVKLYTTKASTTSDYFGLYLDEFYEKVREDMNW